MNIQDPYNLLPDKDAKTHQDCENVTGVVSQGVLHSFSKPMPVSGLLCPICGFLVKMTFLEKDPVTGKQFYVGICSDSPCTKKMREKLRGPKFHEPLKSNYKWKDFCVINGIGDNFYSLNHENLAQNEKCYNVLKQFKLDPHGLWWLNGKYGTGKTYTAMCICEMFIRNDPSCIFMKEYMMSRKWLQSRESNEELQFIQNVEKVHLLVVDDVGHGGGTPGFNKLFRDIIDQRNQYTSLATVITTNFGGEDAHKHFDPSLVDRMRSSKNIPYGGKSRR